MRWAAGKSKNIRGAKECRASSRKHRYLDRIVRLDSCVARLPVGRLRSGRREIDGHVQIKWAVGEVVARVPHGTAALMHNR